MWRFQGSEGIGRKEIYMMLAKVKRGTFWQGDEAQSLDFMKPISVGWILEIWIVIS